MARLTQETRSRSLKMKEPLRISLGQRTLECRLAPLTFVDGRWADLFARQNNKSLRETIKCKKYLRLAKLVRRMYPGSLEQRLGEFVLTLKNAADPFYRRFLNVHGDEVYCKFGLRDTSLQKLKGLYCFTIGGTVKYVGKSIDSCAKRINQGYGRIDPKKCYLDGNSTNCHLNARIAVVAAKVRLYVRPMRDDAEIRRVESALIREHRPEWNKQLVRD
jgi:hypothetical protein